jgi:hypothetical protein
MTRDELGQALVEKGVDPYDYFIAGVSTGAPRSLGELVLEQRGPRWVVYTFERGVESDHQYFATEDQACRHMINALEPAPEDVGQLTEEDERLAREIAASNAQEMRDWLIAQGRDPETGRPVSD